MKALPILLLVLTACGAFAGCGDSACDKAIAKEIECEPDPERKKDMKESKSIAVAFCEGDKSPEQKQRLECYKRDTCEAVEQCEAELRAADDAKEVNEKIAAGQWDDAISSCTWNAEAYAKVPSFKEACDKAITEGFGKIENASYKCQGDDFMKVSESLQAACAKLGDEMKAKVQATRDAGGEYDYMMCSNYKDIAKADATRLAAAEQLCAEAEVADDAKKAIDEAKANIAAKEADIPYNCKYFLDNKEKLGKSAWFEGKAKEVAKTCFGDLGKLALAEVGSWCGMGAKDVHAVATEFKLGDADAELAALLTKTAKLCAE